MEVVKNDGFFKWLYLHKAPILVIQLIELALSVVSFSQYFIPKEDKFEAIVYPYDRINCLHGSHSEQIKH